MRIPIHTRITKVFLCLVPSCFTERTPTSKIKYKLERRSKQVLQKKYLLT